MKFSRIALFAFLTIAFALISSAVATTLFNKEKVSRIAIKIEKTDSDKVIYVQLSNLDKKRTQVNIVDFNGKQWYGDSFHGHERYAKKFNLRNLDSGEYMLVVSHNTLKNIVPFSVTLFDVAIYDNDRDEYFGLEHSKTIASIKSDEGSNTLQVRLANLYQQPVIMRIVSSSGSEIYKKTITGENFYQSRISLKNVNPDSYCLSLQSWDLNVLAAFVLDDNQIEITNVYRRETLRDSSAKMPIARNE